MGVPSALIELLRAYDPAVRTLAVGLRAMVLEEVAPAHEYIFPMRSKLVLLYGSSERVIADGICSIAVFRRHATLVFVNGVDLTDPYGMLKGRGKMMRHIRVDQPADFDRLELRAYLRQARTLAGLKRARHSRPGATVTRIKSAATRSPTVRTKLPRLF